MMSLFHTQASCGYLSLSFPMLTIKESTIEGTIMEYRALLEIRFIAELFTVVKS